MNLKNFFPEFSASTPCDIAVLNLPEAIPSLLPENKLSAWHEIIIQVLWTITYKITSGLNLIRQIRITVLESIH